jgi:sucrose-6F-phosphate phosphohydrolase
MKKYLLVCDLDDTLTGDSEKIKTFNKIIFSKKKKFYLVYSSGRFKKSMLALIKKENLIQPNAIVSNIGTEIYYFPSWKKDIKWEKIISKNWERNKKRVLSIINNYNLERQPYEKRFVLSYYNNSEIIIEKIRKSLQTSNIRIIWTKNRLLDIIPKSGGKGNAAKYMSKKLNLPIVACGDSENDTDLLEKSKYGILVGNASNYLKNKFSNHSNVYIANSNHAQGILEGLKYYGII